MKQNAESLEEIYTRLNDTSMYDHVISTMERWLAGEPVWTCGRIIQEWGPEFRNYRESMFTESPAEFRRALDNSSILLKVRDEWIKRFGFAIPCAELLNELAKAEHVVEVGAGSGYMTRLMRHRGINVTGSDSGHSDYKFTVSAHDNHQLHAEAKTMVRRYPNATVFCSWPSYQETWFRQMLRAMKIGQRLIVIREDACATEDAWDYIDSCFTEKPHLRIPTFYFMNDYAGIYVKRRQRER